MFVPNYKHYQYIHTSYHHFNHHFKDNILGEPLEMRVLPCLPRQLIKIDKMLPFIQQQLASVKIIIMDSKFNIKATKGFWTPERDRKLIQLVKMYGSNLSWSQLARAFPGVKGKYIRQRYRNHLDPQLNNFAWTWDEDQILKKCFLKYGSKWELISKYLPGRSANQIKNRTKRREFKQLFPQPPSKKKPWDPAVYPNKNLKKLTIAEQAKATALKQEENHKLMKQQILKEREKDIVEEHPLPQALEIQISKQKRTKLSKAKKFELTTLHLQRTFELIKANLTKQQPSDFYLIFETKTRREIFMKIKAMQWTITQLWPLVTNRTSRQNYDQEIAFFLYCLIKADNKLANKILHRILKCADEEYLMRKIENMIADIDEFIRLELEIIRQKQMHHANNFQKGETLQSLNTNDSLKMELPPAHKMELPPAHKMELPPAHKMDNGEQRPQDQQRHLKIEQQCQVSNERPANDDDQAFEQQVDFDVAIVGQNMTIRAQIEPVRFHKHPKLQCKAMHQNRAKMQIQANNEQNSLENAQSSSSILIYNNPKPIQITSSEKYSSLESEIKSDAEGSNDDSISVFQAKPESIVLEKIEFIVDLAEDYSIKSVPNDKGPQNNSQHDQSQCDEILSDKYSSFFESYQFEPTQQDKSHASEESSNEILMRVKQQHCEVDGQTNKPQQIPKITAFSSILRAKIIDKLRQKHAQGIMTTK